MTANWQGMPFSSNLTGSGSIWPETLGSAISASDQSPIEHEFTVTATVTGGPLIVPDALDLTGAAFIRQGTDSLLEGTDGFRVLVKSYFSSPVALATEGGEVLAPDLVEVLAGSLAPGQYAQIGGGSVGAPIGRVATSEGDAAVTRSDGSVVPLVVDDPVYQGDVVVTGVGSAVGLVFNDDTTFSLGEQGRMVLDKLVFDPDSGEGESAFSVVRGVFVFVSGEIAANNPEDMTVRTPVAVIGIRGTKVAGVAAAEGEENRLVLLPNADGTAGSIVVTTEAGRTLISEVNVPYRVSNAFSAPEPLSFDQNDFDEVFGATLRVLPAAPRRVDHSDRSDHGDTPGNAGASAEGGQSGGKNGPSGNGEKPVSGPGKGAPGEFEAAEFDGAGPEFGEEYHVHGPDGKPLDAMDGVVYGPDGQAYRIIDGVPYSPEGEPIGNFEAMAYGPNGEPIDAMDGVAYGPDGQPYRVIDGVPHSPEGEPIGDFGAIAHGPNGEPLGDYAAYGPDGQPIDGPYGYGSAYQQNVDEEQAFRAAETFLSQIDQGVPEEDAIRFAETYLGGIQQGLSEEEAFHNAESVFHGGVYGPGPFEGAQAPDQYFGSGPQPGIQQAGDGFYHGESPPGPHYVFDGGQHFNEAFQQGDPIYQGQEFGGDFENQFGEGFQFQGGFAPPPEFAPDPFDPFADPANFGFPGAEFTGEIAFDPQFGPPPGPNDELELLEALAAEGLIDDPLFFNDPIFQEPPPDPNDPDFDNGLVGETIEGGAEPNTFFGSDGNDFIDGGGGDDILRGGPGSDQIFGRFGNDLLDGGPGNDMLDGGFGDDLLFSDGDGDTLIGGAGNDAIAFFGTVFANIDGGPGNDTIKVEGAGIIVDTSINMLISAIDGIEEIDLTGIGDNTMVANISGIIAVTDGVNTLPDDPAFQRPNTLVVTGEFGDTLVINNGGVLQPEGATTVAGDPGYSVFSDPTGSVTLVVDDEVALIAA